MINVEKVSEGIDYRVVPNVDDDDRWAVEIIRGPYSNTGFIYDDVQIDKPSGKLVFKFTAISLRDGTPLDSTNRDLQLYAGDVLEDIIKNGIASGAIELDGKDSDQ